MTVITSSSVGFKQLLDLQRLSVEHLETIRQSLESGLSQKEVAEKIDELRKAVETTSNPDTLRDEKTREELSIKQLEDIKKKLQDVVDESVKTREETVEALKEQLEAVSQVAMGVKTFKTLGERFKDFRTNVGEKYGSIDRAAISTGLVREGSFMDRLLGFSKRVEREEFIKKQRLLGSTESTETLKQGFAKAQKSAKLIQAADADIENFKKTTGLSEKEMVKTKKGRELLEKKATATKEYAKYDLAASIKAKDDIDESRKKVEKKTAPENDVDSIVEKTVNSLTDDQIKQIVESIILAIPEKKVESVLAKAMTVFPEERQTEIAEKAKELDPNEPEKIKEFIVKLVETSTQEQLDGIRDIVVDAIPEPMIKSILRQGEINEKLVEKSDIKVNLDTAKESIDTGRVTAVSEEEKAEQDRKDELLLKILELIEENTRKDKEEKKKQVEPAKSGDFSVWGNIGKLGLGIAAVLGGIYGALVGQLKAIQFFAKALLPAEWIAKITSSFKSVVEYASKIKGMVVEAFEFFKFVFAGDPTKGLGKIFATVGGVFEKITTFFTKVFPTVGKYFDDFAKMFGVASKIVGKIAYPLTIILTVWDTLKGAFEGWEEGGLVGAVKGAIKGFFNSLVFGLADLVKSALSWVLGAIGFDSAEKFLDSFSFQDIFNNFVDALFKPFAGLQDMIVGLFTFDLGRMQDGIMKIAESLIDGLMFPINMVKSFISGLFDLVGLDKLSELLDSFDPAQFFKDFVNMLIHPIDTLKKMFDGVVNFFRDIHIPEIGFTIPFIGKKVSIGPFYPFRKDEKEGVRSQGGEEPKKKEIKPEGETKRLADNEAREKFAPAESKPASSDQIKPTGKEGPNWKERLKSYEEMTPVDMYEKLYPGISDTFREMAKKYPPKSDSLQSLDIHERKMTSFLIKGFENGTITPVSKKTEDVKPVQAPSTKAEQLKPKVKTEEKPADFEKQFKRENASRAFRGKIPLSEDEFKTKLRKEEVTKKLGLFDKIKVAFGADPEELAKKTISTKREEAPKGESGTTPNVKPSDDPAWDKFRKDAIQSLESSNYNKTFVKNTIEQLNVIKPRAKLPQSYETALEKAMLLAESKGPGKYEKESADSVADRAKSGEVVKITPTGITSTREAPLESRARELETVAKERGIQGKVTGVYEGFQLTKIRTEDGREIDVSDRLTPDQMKSVQAARTMRAMSQRSEQIEVEARQRMEAGDRVARDSQRVDIMRQDITGGVKPVVVAPAISNNMTTNTQVTKVDAPLRTQDSTIDRYFNARAVY